MKYITTYLLLLTPLFLFSQIQLLDKLSLEKQVDIADIIVEGKVIDKVSYWDVEHKNIYTVHTLEVSKIHKGDAKSEIHIISLGGTVGFKSHSVHPALKLPINTVGVFVAKNANIKLEGFAKIKPLYKSVGLSQGVYRYDLKKGTVTNPFLSFSTHKKLDDTLTLLTDRKAIQLKETNYFKVEKSKKKSFFGVKENQISTLNPTQIAAGNGSVLNIIGVDFGANIGKVRFKNANDGGNTKTEAPETNIESWTDTEINVKVPGGAGSGTVEVETSTGEIYSIEGLVVTHNYLTRNFNHEIYTDGKIIEYSVFHISDHNPTQDGVTSTGNFENGNYVFNYHTDFKSNKAAVEAFERGFNPIVCNAGSKFTISDTTTEAKLADDNINSISFDTIAEEGVLAFVTHRSNAYGGQDPVTKKYFFYFYYYEIDYVFNSNSNWDFDGDATIFQINFNAVVRHETGHAAGLGHVINSNEIMHFSTVAGRNDALTSDPIYQPVKDKIAFDKAFLPTPIPITATDFSECYTLNVIKPVQSSITAYPNPATKSIFLVSELPMLTANIYTLTGKLLKQIPLKNSTSKQLNVSDIPLGHYFISIQFEDKQEVLRFIKSN